VDRAGKKCRSGFLAAKEVRSSFRSIPHPFDTAERMGHPRLDRAMVRDTPQKLLANSKNAVAFGDAHDRRDEAAPSVGMGHPTSMVD